MIKYLILAFAVIVAAQACDSGDDCEDTECCATLGILGMIKRCVRRPKINNYCIPMQLHDEENEIYKFGCPCEDGSECKRGKEWFEIVHKCERIETEKPTTEEETTEEMTEPTTEEMTKPTTEEEETEEMTEATPETIIEEE